MTATADGAGARGASGPADGAGAGARGEGAVGAGGARGRADGAGAGGREEGAVGAGGEGGGEPAVAYFRAIEEAFVRLRGAPRLLSPADFQVASRWQREGVPLGLVLATLEEVFAKRRERGARGRINSLRYCAPAIEAAWAEVQELQGPARREASGEELAVGERLGELAGALPEAEAWDAWRARLLALEGAPAEVEERLRLLDDELVAEVERHLGGAERER